MEKRACFYMKRVGQNPSGIGRYSDWLDGTFHGWSVYSSEPNTPNACAIVEDEATGEIKTVDVEMVRFKIPGA